MKFKNQESKVLNDNLAQDLMKVKMQILIESDNLDKESAYQLAVKETFKEINNTVIDEVKVDF